MTFNQGTKVIQLEQIWNIMNEGIMSRHNIDGVLFSLNFQRYEKVELGDFSAWKFNYGNADMHKFYKIVASLFCGMALLWFGMSMQYNPGVVPTKYKSQSSITQLDFCY